MSIIELKNQKRRSKKEAKNLTPTTNIKFIPTPGFNNKEQEEHYMA
jgi:hypothetical protein